MRPEGKDRRPTGTIHLCHALMASGSGRSCFGGAGGDLAERVDEGLPLLCLHGSHGRVSGVGPAGVAFGWGEVVQVGLPGALAADVVEVEQGCRAEREVGHQRAEQHEAGPVRAVRDVAGVLLGEVVVALVVADRSEQTIAVGQPLTARGVGTSRGGPSRSSRGSSSGSTVGAPCGDDPIVRGTRLVAERTVAEHDLHVVAPCGGQPVAGLLHDVSVDVDRGHASVGACQVCEHCGVVAGTGTDLQHAVSRPDPQLPSWSATIDGWDKQLSTPGSRQRIRFANMLLGVGKSAEGTALDFLRVMLAWVVSVGFEGYGPCRRHQ